MSTLSSPPAPTSSSTPATPNLAVVPSVPSSVQSELLSIAKDLFAGTTGACVGIVVGQPLDTIRVRMQTVAGSESAIKVFQRTVQLEGTRALFKGLTSPLLANAPINAIVFGARSHMSQMLENWFPRTEEDLAAGRPSYWRGALAAAYGGSAQLLVCVPMELVKCKLQVQTTPIHPATAISSSAAIAAASSSVASAPSTSTAPFYKGTWDCIRKIYRAQGIRGLYAGWWVTYWRDVPAYAAWFLAYDWAKTVLQSPEDLAARKPVDQWVTLSAGSLAGLATWISTYPLDVLKSSIQTAPPNTPQKELKMINMAKKNYAAHGFGYFFRGITPTLVRAVPVSAVTFLVYEWCLDLMGRD